MSGEAVFNGEFDRCLTEEDGSVVLTFTAKGADRFVAKNFAKAMHIARQKGKQRFKIEAKEFKENRSLSANAYFHSLIDKIAQVVGIGAEECKRNMVMDYGTIDRDVTGEPVELIIPASASMLDYYPYSKWIGSSEFGGKLFNHYFAYKPTHLLSTSEMAKLIDGVVSEAKTLEIETRTPEELNRMKSLWGACG